MSMSASLLTVELISLSILFTFMQGCSALLLNVSTNSTSDNNFFNINDSVQLTCFVDTQGGAAFTVHWRHRRPDVQISQFVTIRENDPPRNVTTVIRLQNTTEDAGEYRCLAVVVDGSASFTEQLVLTVNVNPFFTSTPDRTIISLNNTNPNSACVADGFPTPLVQLRIIVNDLLMNVPITEAIGMIDVFRGPVQFDDAGRYQCMASVQGSEIAVTFNFTLFIDGFVQSPMVISVVPGSMSANVTWGAVDDPNRLVVSYTVEVLAVRILSGSMEQSISACLRQLNRTDDLRLLSMVDEPSNSSTQMDLIPSTEYQVRVSANTAVRNGNFSDFFTFMTRTDVPGAVSDLSGLTKNTTSILVYWNPPSCPNGPVDGYYLYYRESNVSQYSAISSIGYNRTELIAANLTNLFHILGGLTPRESYAVHVRAVSNGSNGHFLFGEADREILIQINDQIVLPQQALARLNTRKDIGDDYTVIGLPTESDLSAIGVHNISYYGVIVVRDPMSSERDSFVTTIYPDLQPYNESSEINYYITFAWNNIQEVPPSFRVGNQQRTNAIRDEKNETYFNARLSRRTNYCYYTVIHYLSPTAMVELFRYTSLTCGKTGRGYSLIGVIVGSVLAGLLLLLLLILLLCCLVYFCCCRIKRKRRERSRGEKLCEEEEKTAYTKSENIELQENQLIGKAQNPLPAVAQKDGGHGILSCFFCNCCGNREDEKKVGKVRRSKQAKESSHDDKVTRKTYRTSPQAAVGRSPTVINCFCCSCCEADDKNPLQEDYKDRERKHRAGREKPYHQPKEDKDIIIFNTSAIVDDCEYPEYVRLMHMNGSYLFTEEYKAIEPQHLPSTHASRANKAKDRYTTIPAYDHSRVVLLKNPNGYDYINANYISGYKGSVDYIASQGPMEETVIDFWCMIWEQEISQVVMLTNTEEKGRDKCLRYWSDGDPVSYGPYHIKLVEEAEYGDYVIRTLSFTLAEEKPRKLKQYHFTAWIEHTIPNKCDSLLALMDKVQNDVDESDPKPILVHCSSGVSRTGVFITLSVQATRMIREKNVDIYNYVQHMRRQRSSMVLNEREYIFIHVALLEFMKCHHIENVTIVPRKALQNNK